MPRPANSPTRLAHALAVADERAGTLPLRDAIARELHIGLPETITEAEIDDLARRLTKLALATIGAAITVLAKDA